MYMDMSTGRITNELVFIAMTSPVIYMAGNGDYRSILLSAAGAAVMTVLMFPLFAVGVLGGGDVKLCVLPVFYMGFEDAAGCTAVSFAAAAVIGLVKLKHNRLLRERMRYFFSYVEDVRKTGKLRLYEQEITDRQFRNAVRPYQIHFAVPVLISAVMKISGLF